MCEAQREHPSGKFASHSFIAPSCGLGSATVEIVDRAVEVLAGTGELLKKDN